MNRIDILGCTIATSKNKLTIEKWNKLEAYVVGKPCKSLDELLNGLYDHWIDTGAEKQTQPVSNPLPVAEDGRLNELQEHVAQLERQINQLIKSNEGKDTEILLLNQSLSTTIEEKEKLQNVLTQLNGDISSLTDNLISTVDFIEIAKLKEHPVDMVLRKIDSQLSQSLQLIGVSPFEETGNTFDNRFQKIITIQETDKLAQNNIVAESLSKGYKKGDRCLREQDVIVYKYKADGK